MTNTQAYYEYCNLRTKKVLKHWAQKKLLKCTTMDKLKLTGLNLGRVFNYRSGCASL
jgi:hypothetical protein